jgi:hypothetical protein
MIGEPVTPVLHGLLGFDTLFGVDYFYGIPSALTRVGAPGWLWRRCPPPAAPRCVVSNCWRR